MKTCLALAQGIFYLDLNLYDVITRKMYLDLLKSVKSPDTLCLKDS